MKLKKLILAGFKSFADRTEFEFDDGISCVVGPNGCGKSNIVDAVKWVLGEQSAKSLRGSEMLDVIFNGSSTRRGSGMAQVTLVFDNDQGLLRPMIQGEEQICDVISLSRRLYRSGQSEYLINKQPCRLRDVREMLMDTGIGVDAYSVIEQGQVSAFLQASQDDRRAIFDEVAGISKYKARKREAMRKLERVEQNMLRLTDILAEVEKRLRSIKLQAGKARNYQIHAERLKELKSLHFLAQYYELTGHRRQLQSRLDTAHDALAALEGRIKQLESTASGAEVEIADLEQSARDRQARLAATSGRINTSRQRSEMLSRQVKQLGELIVSASHRSEQLQAKAETLADEVARREAESAGIRAQLGQLAESHDAVGDEHAAGVTAIAHVGARLEDEKAGTVDILRRTAQLHSEITSHGVRRESLRGQRSRLTDRAEQISETLRRQLTERAELETKLGDVRAVLAAAEDRLAQTRASAKTLAAGERALHSQLSAAREQRSAVLSRTEVLEEMEARMEGIATGVQRVLQERRRGELPSVIGMLGDFIETDVEHAAVVESALAGAAQQLLMANYAELSEIADRLREMLGEGGAIEVTCLDRLGSWWSDFDVSSCPHVLGRVIDGVRFPARLAPLMWRVLGGTLIVASLDDAVLAARDAPRDARFVTLAGEVLEPDGAVRFGAGNRGGGVIARHSELADLAARREELDVRIAALDEKCTSAREELKHLQHVEQSVRTAIYEANTERVEADSRLTQLTEEIDKLQQEQPVVTEDLRSLAEEIETTVRAEHDARQRADELERIEAERESAIANLTERLAAAGRRQDELSQKMTELKVTLASAQQKRTALEEVLEDLRRQREQVDQELESSDAEIEGNRQRRGEAQSGIENADREVEQLTVERAALQQEADEFEESCAGLRQKLQAAREQLTQQRGLRNEAGESLNAARVESGEADVRIENLIARANDEMDMNLPELYQQYEHDEARDWDAVGVEIQELRRKMERLGNVNLDAISEQQELEQRRQHFADQIHDVQDSERQLHDLIRRINRESRDRFVETFGQVRENFQVLFRKLFGGGRADIMLMDPDDVLESGIEILARPPGKDLRNMTLLSGGEKTMTALALLFSIFRTRPSPFCLLDEVDAALDEANTERFTTLVDEFVKTSQFIIISHAKRTMSMANVLYGVTMQEPGVSTRISVRFEDVGHKLDEQLEPVAT